MVCKSSVVSEFGKPLPNQSLLRQLDFSFYYKRGVLPVLIELIRHRPGSGLRTRYLTWHKLFTHTTASFRPFVMKRQLVYCVWPSERSSHFYIGNARTRFRRYIEETNKLLSECLQLDWERIRAMLYGEYINLQKYATSWVPARRHLGT